MSLWALPLMHYNSWNSIVWWGEEALLVRWEHSSQHLLWEREHVGCREPLCGPSLEPLYGVQYLENKFNNVASWCAIKRWLRIAGGHREADGSKPHFSPLDTFICALSIWSGPSGSFLSPHCTLSSPDCDHWPIHFFKKRYKVSCCSITADCRKGDFSLV